MAAKFFFMAGCHTGKAVKELEKLDMEDKPTALRQLVQMWPKRFEETGSVFDAPHTGRIPKVPYDVVLECARAFGKGEVVEEGRRTRHYKTYDEAREINPLFNVVIEKYDIEPDTLLRAMERVEPELTKRREEVKPHFNEVEEHMRQKLAAYHLEGYKKDKNYFMTWIHVDEASVYLCQLTHRLVWCFKRDERPIAFSDELRTKCKDHVKWYIAVSPLLGVFGPYFTTGTTGQERYWPVSEQTRGVGTLNAYIVCYT